MITVSTTSDPDVLIERQAWNELEHSLQHCTEPGDVWLRTLARNLASMQIHRPALYGKVVAALPTFSGDLNDARFNAERSELLAHEIFAATQLLRQAGRAVALAGIGDGTVLRVHARYAPSLILGRLQEVTVLEPDFDRLIAGLGCTDVSGPRGAFEQWRIKWYVGETWVEDLARDLIEQPTRMPPTRSDPPTSARPEIEAGIERVNAMLQREQIDRKERIDAYYGSLSDEELVNVFGPTPQRKPRVLMITSQFTAVLQYSTYDSAHAMRELGWEVEICTEREMWHSVSPPSIAAAIDSFKPDLVFHIDHLRYELGDLVPDNLPFVCWIQDHLTNLTNDAAGGTIGERDFVLTGGAYRYVTRYGYPRRQCIDMPKCSRPPVLPARWACDREDVIYVSHWSHTTESTTAETCSRIRDYAGTAGENAIRRCCEEMLSAYKRGESFRTDLETRTLVRRVLAGMDYTCEAKTEQIFVDILFQRLNQVCYRQESLTWTAEIAEELGLKFGLYGLGWEKHPTLGRYARGVVKYGPDLEAITRESRILLQIEPYGCYTHQRMLDAILAGGFALIREHPLNTLPIKVRQFLDAYVPPEIISVPEAADSLSPPLRAEFDRLLEESKIIAAMGDVVDVVRGWQRAGIIGTSDEVLPHLGEICFDSRETLKERIEYFISHDDVRRQIGADQRACVLERLTYRTALERAMRQIHSRLVESCRAAGTSIREAA